MTEIQNSKQYNLEERTFQFAKKVVLFCKKLPRSISNIEYVKQIIRASGSNQWPIPPVFKMIQEIEKVSRSEIRRVFNLGIGMVLIVPFEQVKAIRGALGRDHWVLGAIWQRKDKEEKVVFQQGGD